MRLRRLRPWVQLLPQAPQPITMKRGLINELGGEGSDEMCYTYLYIKRVFLAKKNRKDVNVSLTWYGLNLIIMIHRHLEVLVRFPLVRFIKAALP